jgi:glycine dehydrogenase subunit 1
LHRLGIDGVITQPISTEVTLSYILNTPADQRDMLAAIGTNSVEDLFASIPASLRLGRPLDVPPPLTELALQQHVGQLARSCISPDDAVCFLGGGSYDHFIPAVVDAVAGRSEFYTAYTPYQAEASQGSLQAFFEYQTLIAELTGLDVANASLYDGGSAVPEAVLMARSIMPKRHKVVVAESVHPEYRQALSTYLANLDATIVTVSTPGGHVDLEQLQTNVSEETLCVVIQHPNFFGGLEDVEAISKLTHDRGALFIVSFDPISLGLLKRPGQYLADIAIAEGQCLGNPMAYGGPYLGILACREEFVRKMPGRLVGQTVDRQGKRCWVLTLQTREQHIRREKATSNICTNQGLFALRAAVYLAALGPKGLQETAELCTRKAHYAAEQLTRIPGVSMKFAQPFFKEFVVQLPIEAKELLARMLKVGHHAGLDLGCWYPGMATCMSIAVTEKRTKAEIDAFATAMARVLAG